MVRVAVTGHRPEKLFGYDYNHVGYKKLQYMFEQYILQAAKTSVNTTEDDLVEVITGMALGADQIFALAALHLRDMGYHIKLVACIPFRGYEDRWQESSKILYNKILERADLIIYACDGGYAPYKMQARNELMVDRLIEENDFLIVVWDGSDSGTKNCFYYARDKKKNIRLIEPQYICCQSM